MEDKVVYIINNSHNKEHSVDDCEETITVWELIDALKDYPLDTNVVIRNDGGYTYCPLDKDSIKFEKKDY